MDVKVIKEEGLEREYEVLVPANDIEKQVELRLQREAANINLPGFRKGKVPMKVLKQRYGKMVMGEVLEATVNETNLKLFKEKDLKPAMQPQINVADDFDMGKDLKYTMKFEVLPDIKIADVSDLKLTKEVVEAGDKEVEEALERLAKQKKSSEAITTKRAAKKGDTVIIDFDGSVDGERKSGMQAEKYTLELGSGSFIPGFEDQITGHKAGEEFDVNVTFPEGYMSKELSGKDAVFKVTLHEIRENKLPEIDDAFAGTLGFDDLAALKDALKEQAQKEYDRVSRQKIKKELLDDLDAKHKFEAPQTMVEAEFQQIAVQAHPEHQGHHDHDVRDHMDKDEIAELESIADRRVRLGIVLSEIGNQQDVQVSNDEIQQAVIAEARKYPGQEAQVFEYFKSNPMALEQVKAPIFEEKVTDYLLSTVSVTEKKVSVEDLLKDDEAEEKQTKAKKKASGSAKGAMGGSAKKSTAKKDTAKKPTAKKKTAAKKS